MDHRKHTKLIKFNDLGDVIFVVVTIRMVIIQYLVIANKKKSPITCRIKVDLSKTFKEIIKATQVAQVQISLMAGGSKITIHILVPLTLLLQVLLTTLMEVLQIGVHNNNNNDRGATSPSNDPLHGIGGPMTRSKTKRMKQALQGPSIWFLLAYIVEGRL